MRRRREKVKVKMDCKRCGHSFFGYLIFKDSGKVSILFDEWCQCSFKHIKHSEINQEKKLPNTKK